MKTFCKSLIFILVLIYTSIFAASKITPQLANAIAEAEQNGSTVHAVIELEAGFHGRGESNRKEGLEDDPSSLGNPALSTHHHHVGIRRGL